MNEAKKTGEGEYFLSQMRDSERDWPPFGYNLSAFLTAARSALQFALEEAANKPGGRAWYNKRVTGNQIVGFFKDKRNFNIHKAPLEIRKDVQVNIEGVQLHMSVGAITVRADAEIPAEAPASSITQRLPQADAPRPPKVTVSEAYRFSEWNGPEDIKTLCRSYLSEVEKIISDGHKKGFLKDPFWNMEP